MSVSENSAKQPSASDRKASPWKTIVVPVVALALIGGGLWYWRTARLSGSGGWAGGGLIEPVQATISAIEPQVARDTRNASIQAEVDDRSRKLQPGMYATVAVALPPEANALTLPVSAVMTSASGDAAAVVRELSPENTGKAEIVPIVVGRRIGDQVVIAHGLKAGDVVITEGQSRVRRGALLRVVDKSAAIGEPAGGR